MFEDLTRMSQLFLFKHIPVTIVKKKYFNTCIVYIRSKKNQMCPKKKSRLEYSKILGNDMVHPWKRFIQVIF